jgi:acyl dehydratase
MTPPTAPIASAGPRTPGVAGALPTGGPGVGGAVGVLATAEGVAVEGDVVGRRYHVPRFALDPEVAVRFAAVVGAKPGRFGPVAHPCLVARPALCVLHAVLADPAVRADRSTMLHAQSDITWHAPLRLGADVAIDAEIVDAGPYGSRRGLEVVTRVAEPGGQTLADLQTVLAFAPPALAVAEGRPRLEAPPSEPHDATVVADRAVRFDADFPARYAAASGDTNPLHLDGAAARAAGLPGVVLHGLSTVAVGATFAIDALAGGDPTALTRLRVRFARPGRPGDLARYTAYRTGRPGRFALSCRVGSTPIWRQSLLDIRA